MASTAPGLVVRDGTLVVTGALTFSTVDVAVYERSRALVGDAAVQAVDLSGVSAADSAGLALLIEWQSVARAGGRSLALRGVPAGLRAIADISDVEQLIQMEEAAAR